MLSMARSMLAAGKFHLNLCCMHRGSERMHKSAEWLNGRPRDLTVLGLSHVMFLTRHTSSHDQ